MDSAPRCRPDGFLANDEDEDESVDRPYESLNGQVNDDGHQPRKTVIRGTYGWMLAHRVVQLRWAVPELLQPKRRSSTDDSHNSEIGKLNSDSYALNSKGSEGIGSLIDSLGYSQGALLDYTSLAIRCVEVLRKLCDSCSSRDIHGGVVRPLPKPRRVICSNECLTHIVQVRF